MNDKLRGGDPLSKLHVNETIAAGGIIKSPSIKIADIGIHDNHPAWGREKVASDSVCFSTSCSVFSTTYVYLFRMWPHYARNSDDERYSKDTWWNRALPIREFWTTEWS